MAMPIDISAVMEEALNVDAARTAALRVSVYFDEFSPGDVQAHVRQAFASASPTARVALSYLDGRPFAPYAGDDMAVVVAGAGEQPGVCARLLREAGVPCMVVTSMPRIVEALAREAGSPIPPEDLVAPRAPRADAEVEGGAQEAAAAVLAEPYAMDEAACASLDARMGQWIVEACEGRRLAFALAFPFVRRPLALEAVSSTALQNAGVGVMPLLSSADLPIMTLNQAKMVILIAAAYGLEMAPERALELALVVGGAFACRRAARALVAAAPGGRLLVKGAVGWAGTQAVGRAAIALYEDGRVPAAVSELVGLLRERAGRPEPPDGTAPDAADSGAGAPSAASKVASLVARAAAPKGGAAS